jgi:hypothetical protein
MLYFTLNNDGLLYNLGDHEKWENAEEYAQDNNIDSIWLFNENEAKSWVNFINETLQTTESKK